LAVSSVTLDPSFDPASFSYVDTVSNSIASVTVTPVLNYSMATVTVNGIEVNSGSESGAITLNDGNNAISIVVSAEDGISTNTYSVSIVRFGDPTLSNITLSAGSLIPPFHPDSTVYTVELTEANPSISLIPTSASSTAVIKVNGAIVSSGSASGPHNLNPGTTTFTLQVSAEVTAEKEYTVTAYRGFYDLRDSTFYNVTDIGTQTWMVENLNFDPSTSNSWCYEDNENNCNTYGRLYSWDIAVADNYGNGEDICPSGWHLPSDADWKTLEMAIGMTQSEADKEVFRGIDEGSKLKSETQWNGTDEYGFSALPGGHINNNGGGFSFLGSYAHFWASTEYDAENAWSRTFQTDEIRIGRTMSGANNGFSVRCVLGVLINHPPEFTSTTGDMVDTGTVGSQYLDTAYATDPDRDYLNFSLLVSPANMSVNGGIVTWTPSNLQIGDTNVVLQVSDGNGAYDTLNWAITVSDTNHAPVFTSNISDMNPDGQVSSQYIDTMHATDNNGDNLSFSFVSKPANMAISDSIIIWTPNETQLSDNDIFVQVYDGEGGYDTLNWVITVIDSNEFKDYRDDNVYRRVIISTQTWMAENLNFNVLTGNSWCYNDSTENCDVYGALYDQNTAVADNHGNGSDVCPVGWHLPTQAEWTTLANAIGGATTAGKKLKAITWNGTDDYQFTVLPSGNRQTSGDYWYLGGHTYFWNPSFGYYIYMSDSDDLFMYSGVNSNNGFSIRCIQD
ncbi:FISUMP domain-containing protein, partial [Fibrobacterota bacterium]